MSNRHFRHISVLLYFGAHFGGNSSNRRRRSSTRLSSSLDCRTLRSASFSTDRRAFFVPFRAPFSISSSLHFPSLFRSRFCLFFGLENNPFPHFPARFPTLFFGLENRAFFSRAGTSPGAGVSRCRPLGQERASIPVHLPRVFPAVSRCVPLFFELIFADFRAAFSYSILSLILPLTLSLIFDCQSTAT